MPIKHLGTSRNSEFADEVQGARRTETGVYEWYMRISSTAQRGNSPQKWIYRSAHFLGYRLALALIFSAGLPSLSVAATQSFNKADIVAVIQSIRSAGCNGLPSQKPLQVTAALDQAAQAAAQGEAVEEALKKANYYFLNVAIFNASYVPNPTRLRNLLVEKRCAAIMQSDIHDLGVWQNDEQMTILLAAPVLTHLPNLEPVEQMWQDMVSAVNQVRSEAQQCGAKSFPAVGPVRLNPTLVVAAENYAQDLANHNYLAHQGRDGSTPGQRLTRAGYEWQAVAENLAGGPTSVTEVVAGWLKSPGHCVNLMNASVNEMGIAYAINPATHYRIYWVQVFGHQKELRLFE